MDKETQELMDEMKADGETFAEPETPKEETPTPEPKEEQKEELEGEKPKDEEIEEAPEEPPERTPRKPKEIPAWKAKIAEKRAAKEAKAEAVEQPKEDIKNEPKQEVSDAKDKIAKLKEKYKDTVTEQFLDDLADLIPSKSKVELPDEVKDKLKRLDEVLASNSKQKEDLEYNQHFSAQVAPLLKEQHPSISDEDLQSVQTALKNHYFDERYISLSAKEIYTLKADELKDLISPEPKSGGEKGTKGVARGNKEIDYSNITEEEYANLSDEEAQKVEDYLVKTHKH